MSAISHSEDHDVGERAAHGPLAIAFLSHMASRVAPTGAERSLALLAAGMSARGHRVTVVKPGPWALESSLRASRVEMETIPCRACWLTYHGSKPGLVALARWFRWAWPQSSGRRIRRYLSEWGPDVVHVNCLPHLRGAAAAAALDLPVIWHLREIVPAGRRRRWLASALARHATVAVAVSEATGEWIRAEGLGERLRVIPNGVEPVDSPGDGREDRGRLGLPPDGVLFGLFGQLLPHKGAEAFVVAACRSLAVEPGSRFVLAGAGPDSFRRRLQEVIARSGFAERFHLLPPQPSGESLVRAADVVCLATTTPDPLPRAVMEAMAAGRPIAAFASGGTGEMVVSGETGLLVPPGDIDALGRAFVTLAGDRSLRESMGQAGARRVRQEFSLERHLDLMEDVFRSAVG